MKLWRPQFSIQSLMLLTVIVGLFVGWSVDHDVQSREHSLRASELRRMESQFDRITHVLEKLQDELARDGIKFDYDLDRVRFSLDAPHDDDAKRRVRNISG